MLKLVSKFVAALELLSYPARRSLGTTPRSLFVLSLVGGLWLAAGTASAWEGIDLSGPPPAEEEGQVADKDACPKLIQIKYPFLTCTNGLIDRPDANATWENSRRIPLQTDFLEGDGYFGPDLNME